MRVVRTIRELRAELAERRGAGAARVGLVPTMGALHEGHLSLLRAARAENDAVVLSIFVNPKQFTEGADLDAYPRTEVSDTDAAEAADVDIVFAPAASEMYPAGYATTVSVGGALTETLEGAGRGTAHFDGVATVVAKLLIAVGADAAYFGQKDAQQLLVVRRMAADLGIPTRIVSCPTQRDDDGLALSSRNTLLSDEERSRAVAIPRALQAVRSAVLEGARDVAELRTIALSMLHASNLEPEYLAFADPATLEEVAVIDRPVLVAIAARVGAVRLIDNLLLGSEPEQREES
ncbi:pantoate--beta-alanine ligase [Leucobacter sp. GX24907]